jgi:hypothetical protein
VPKTPYEIWTDRKPTLNYLHVWGCLTEAKLFNPSIEKLSPKTISYHFIGYPDKSKRLCFYCPDRYIKIVKTRHTVFLKDEVIRGSTVPREVRLEEKWVYVPSPMVAEPFFSVPTAVTHMVQGNVIAEPVVDSPVPVGATAIVGSPMAEVDDEVEPIFKNLLPIMRRSNKSLLYRMCYTMNLLEDLRGPEGRLSLMTTRFMLVKKFKWRVIPPLLKKP